MILQEIKHRLAELDKGKSLILKVKIIPKSSKNEIVKLLGKETVKIKITAAPEKGKANEQLIKFLSQQLDLRQNQIRIKSGANSSLKILEIQIG